VGLANLLKVSGTAVRATVAAGATLITVMFATIKALIDVAKCQSSYFCSAVWAIAKGFVV